MRNPGSGSQWSSNCGSAMGHGAMGQGPWAMGRGPWVSPPPSSVKEPPGSEASSAHSLSNAPTVDNNEDQEGEGDEDDRGVGRR